MIIATIGKIGAGKDVTGALINYLIWKSKVEKGELKSLNYTINNFIDGFTPKPFKVMKFAEKIKVMVCMMLDCSRDLLEDREFKNKELGEEWWYYKVPKVGGGFELISYLDNDKSESWISIANPRYLIKMTPRLLMQVFGTNAGRGIVHPNIWVNSLMSEYKSIDGHYPDWIITDCRFPNELKAIEDKGGFGIKILRSVSARFPTEYTEFEETGRLRSEPAFIDWLATHTNKEYVKLAASLVHESEVALDEIFVKHTITNNGTILDLLKKVKEILIFENII